MVRRMRKHLRRGFTLVELSVAVVIIGVLLSLAAPAFSRVREQTRLDAAAQYLRSIWAAERIYWLENRTFTNSLGTLNSMGLIDPRVAAGNDGCYDYVISTATSDSLTVSATRDGSAWTGTLTIQQDGEVTGFVSSGGKVLTPPDI